MIALKTLRAAFITAVAGLGLAGCEPSADEATNNSSNASAAAPAPTPFASNNGTTPPAGSGPLFQLSYAYPSQLPVGPVYEPWRQAIGNGPITTANAGAYAAALKTYVTPRMRKYFLANPRNLAPEGMYNEPWLGAEREPLHGTYVGSEILPVSQYPGTGLTAPFTTYVLTFYDQRAANTLYNVWGTSAMNPALTATSGQFATGAVIVKAAFTTANADVWPPMAGALQWQLYASTNATLFPDTPNYEGPTQLMNASFFQFDIIVKDPASAPGTGWVFTTLVYDKDAPGKDVWDKMVPLGAMWGNDPMIDSSKPNPPPLQENWINPAAPAYAKTTLGWGGRLSGPNDGALNDSIIGTPDGPKIANLATSSCMACHISAQFPDKSFLLPSTTNPPTGDPTDPNSDYFVVPVPGSADWMRWFQSSPGTQAMDPGTTPFDYDMVFAFKTLPAWQKATQSNTPLQRTPRGRALIGRNYDGLPFGSKPATHQPRPK
ncbi:MAG TPA: hypothetical protein VFZ91_13180 [Allosphingosinicella sp.]